MLPSVLAVANVEGVGSRQSYTSDLCRSHPTPTALLRCYSRHPAGCEGGHGAKIARNFVALSAENPLCLYGIADRRAYGLSTHRLLEKSLRSPLCAFLP